MGISSFSSPFWGVIFRTNSFVSDGFILSYFTIETNGNFLKYPIRSGSRSGTALGPLPEGAVSES
jgi:hypothetical protein